MRVPTSLPRRVAAILTLVLVGTLGTVTAATAQEITPAKGPVALTGTADVPLDDAYFWVYIEPDSEVLAEMEDGHAMEAVTLPSSAVTISGATFTVSIDPASVPARYIDRYGNIHVGIEVTVPGDRPLVGSAEATLTLVDGRWANPMAVSHDTGQFADASAPADVTVPLRLHDATGNELAAPLPTSDDMSIACRAQWKHQRTSYPWVIIGSSYAVENNKAKVKYSSTRSHSTTMGIGVSTTNVSWSQSSTKTLTQSWSFEWPESGVDKAYQIQVKYYKYRLYDCDRALNRWKWTPILETGATTQYYLSSVPKWRHCISANRGTFTRGTDKFVGKSYKHSAGVKFKGTIGIDLSLSSQWGRSKQLIYRIVSGGTKLCGNNGEPAVAGKVLNKQGTRPCIAESRVERSEPDARPLC